MRPEPRAVLFDLDDTLYPLQQFLLSGFRAVAAHVQTAWDHDAGAALEVLTAAYSTDRGHELDVLALRLALPAGAAAALIRVMQMHTPSLQLPSHASLVLAAMRPTWRTGIVTNGRADIQARKVAALGLASLVDTVVLAAEHGSGVGKPDAAPFLAACLALGVTPAQTVFVGDDLDCDIVGAHAVGMQTIWLPSTITPQRAAALACADLMLPSLAGVPVAADQLFESRWSCHVA